MDNEQEQDRGSRLAGGDDGWLRVSPHHESEAVIAWDGNAIPVLYHADCPPNVVYVIPSHYFDQQPVDGGGADPSYFFRHPVYEDWEYDAYHWHPSFENDD